MALVQCTSWKSSVGPLFQVHHLLSQRWPAMHGPWSQLRRGEWPVSVLPLSVHSVVSHYNWVFTVWWAATRNTQQSITEKRNLSWITDKEHIFLFLPVWCLCFLFRSIAFIGVNLWRNNKGRVPEQRSERGMVLPCSLTRRDGPALFTDMEDGPALFTDIDTDIEGWSCLVHWHGGWSCLVHWHRGMVLPCSLTQRDGPALFTDMEDGPALFTDMEDGPALFTDMEDGPALFTDTEGWSCLVHWHGGWSCLVHWHGGWSCLVHWHGGWSCLVHWHGGWSCLVHWHRGMVLPCSLTQRDGPALFTDTERWSCLVHWHRGMVLPCSLTWRDGPALFTDIET